MSSEEDKPARDDGTAPGRADDNLGNALDDLETMLDRHRAADDPERGEPRGADGDDDEDDGQYSIPLLNDVVLPPPSGPQPSHRVPLDDDYDEAVERMTERLASEIDVIVQSAVEEAVDLLRRDVAERLREHIEITLPEVLEELVQQRQKR